ncbi:MAG: molybdopterin molybdotransferase MoeA [Proteobacteria bacterium]|nr:molybdopterin molybdotransferase MoeA [Pseudomonadota bacterium]
MKAFFKVRDVAMVHALAQELEPLPAEEVPLPQALGRSLARPLAAPADLPGFTRATMDGYAVRARDTFGAGEISPGYLHIVGEVRMGQAPEFSLEPGQCARIGTGGMLPPGSDAVVMVEHTRRLDDTSLEVATSVAPGANTLGPTDDAARGQELLPRGQRLRPQDLGLLAALGQEKVVVLRRPRVGIVSTGDEVVPVSAATSPGQVRDVNTYTLAAQISQAGGEPLPLGLVPDQANAIREAADRSLENCDLTLLSGGSSVGTRDFTSEVFLSFPGAELLVHGVAVSPGKPFLWVRAQAGHLIGLPGQVASCLVAFYLLVEPILERLQGRPALPFARFARLPAVLARNIPSAPGREEYLRVSLDQQNGRWLAQPLFGKSGLLTTLIQGQGLVRVPKDCEGLDAGEAVEVLLFPS